MSNIHQQLKKNEPTWPLLTNLPQATRLAAVRISHVGSMKTGLLPTIETHHYGVA